MSADHAALEQHFTVSTIPDAHSSDAPDPRPVPRRAFLLTGLGLVLTGCSQPRTADLPSPAWPNDTPPSPEPYSPSEPRSTTPTVARPGHVIPRSTWASAQPVPRLMNRMSPVRYITIHHDGMRPFLSTDQRSTGARLDAIRNAHRGMDWGDIGYHFAVDRNGRVWECRPLVYQGAHVKNHNPGNIGVVALGNFDEQTPSSAQLEAVKRHVTWLMRTYRVPVSRVRTHQEWETARTRCPGTHMQRYMVAARSSRWLG